MNKKVFIIIILLIAIPLCYAYEYNKQNNKKNRPTQANLVNETIKYDVNVKQITANYTSLEDLSAKFDLDDAIRNNCFVYIDGREYNKEVYTTFISNYESQEPVIARVAKNTDEGDTIVLDLDYDGSTITVKEDSTRDKFASKENQKIITTQYNHTGQLEKDNNSYWVVYNKDVNEDFFVISQINK